MHTDTENSATDTEAISSPHLSSPLDLQALISTASPHHPSHWPLWQKWSIATIYCLLQVAVMLLSTTYTSVEAPLHTKFGGSTQVIALGQSMFIVGNAAGPVFLGPLSDLGGRKWVYVGSVAMYGLCQIGCALALNLPMMIIFMLLSGVACSTAMSNVAGTIADLFGNADNTSQPLALFIVSSTSGSSLGGVVGVWIVNNPNMGSIWIFWINVILAGVFVLILAILPETLPRVVISRATRSSQAKQSQSESDEQQKEITKLRMAVLKEIRFVTTMCFRILFTEPIVTCLGLFNGYIYGLLFLYLYGVFDVFVVNNRLSVIAANLTYLNFVAGVVIMFLIFVPIQTSLYKRDRLEHNGIARPEARFLLSLITVWGFPISLLWFAFTSSGNVSYWSPVIAGGVLGVADPLLWLSILNYITDSYPNVAGSAIAAFLIPSQLLAAGCVHIGILMFENLSTRWAFAILGFVSFGVIASVYVLYFWGPALRRMSKLAMNPSPS
uniref:Putative transporter n=1 Tax=Talaromyces marneffei PM1 TaxID=1077442 RepID=A0A093UZN0_TALMA